MRYLYTENTHIQDIDIQFTYVLKTYIITFLNYATLLLILHKT